jgi:two-component system, chemotaxis family, protein-glutamate methylesterase/glutaminase
MMEAGAAMGFEKPKAIEVLVVEDSAVVRELLVHILDADPQIRVVGTAHNGEEALKAVDTLRPDVITMDINMPRMNGFEATRRIMETQPTPIVIVSGSWDAREVETTFQALDAGALAAIPRPMGIGHPEHAKSAQEMVQTVKLMSEVKVIRRRPRLRSEEENLSPRPPVSPRLMPRDKAIQLVAMGASTGGPPVLMTILSQLPKEFPIPVLVVQHMASGFIRGFAEWLQHATGLPVQLAVQDERILPGHVYVAPDGYQMKAAAGGRISLAAEGSENGVRPSVSCLFRSVAEVCGPNAVGILLTGMGRDGAEELQLMKKRGAITIAQNEETSVVFGMPGEAVKLDAAAYILSPDQIAPMLVSLANKNRKDDLAWPINQRPPSP